MQIHRVALLLLTLSTVPVYASRIYKRGTNQNNLTVAGGKACHVVENDHSLKYGIKGSWHVPSCTKCTFYLFLTQTFYEDVVSGAEPSEDDENCKCYTSPKFWEAKGLDKKFWFQFDKTRRECSKTMCKDVFLTWANMFNRKSWTIKEGKVAGEKMPLDLFIESQEGYELRCDDSEPEGLHIPSPASKILELRLQIEECTDPDEKLRLQQMLDELLAENEVEVFAYALEEEFNPTEHEADASADGEHHTFYLKPCKSQKGNEVTELGEIIELCGPAELGISMKGGQLRVNYEVDEPWGPERACKPSEEECQLVQNIAADEGVVGEILSFRLRQCKSPSGTEVEELSEIFKEKSCGPPSTKKDSDGFATLLPVKMDVSSKYDEAAPSTDVLEYPCADDS